MKLKLIPDAEQIELFEQVKSILNDYDIASVAYHANVAQSTLYFWLDGTTRKPRLDTIVRVADALGYELVLNKRQVRQAARHLRVVK